MSVPMPSAATADDAGATPTRAPAIDGFVAAVRASLADGGFESVVLAKNRAAEGEPRAIRIRRIALKGEPALTFVASHATRDVTRNCTVEAGLAAIAGHLDRKVRLDFVYEVIGELTEMRHRKALLLSGGQQKLVALGRALSIGTKCLLLDEPFEGIAPALSERLSEVLASLKGKDLTLLMSQSDMNHSRGLIDFEFTIERGANPAAG